MLAEDGARVLAGGTDLVLAMKRNEARPRAIIDVSQLPAMRGIWEEEVDGQALTVIGAAVTFAEVASSPWIRAKARLLAQAASVVGSPQIRNRGTIGGNIANGSPAADTVPALVALSSRLRIIGKDGRREVDLEEVLQAPPGKTALAPHDLIYQIVFPTPPQGARSAFVKLGRRNSLAIARISVAALLVLDEEGRITQAAVSLGAVAPHPFRVRSAEAVLVGSEVKVNDNHALLEAAIEAIVSEATQTLGNRASAPYKRQAVRGVAWDALAACLGAEEGV